MTRKLIALCCLSAAVFLAACGKSDTAPSADGGTSPKQEETAETEKADSGAFAEIGDDYTLNLPIYMMTEYTGYAGTSTHHFKDFQFDDQSRLISYSVNEKDRRYDSWANEYDEKGRLVKRTYDDPLYGKVIDFTYNDADQILSEQTTSTDDGKVTSVHSYTYDENGMMASAVTDATGDHYVTKYEYAYDDKGRIVQQNEYDESEGPRYLDYTYTYEYDDANRLSAEHSISYNEDGSKRSAYDTTLKYDLYGHLVQYSSQETFTDDKDGKLFKLEIGFPYEAAAERTVNAAESDTLAPASEWKAFSEDAKMPTPDSIMPTLAKPASESGDGSYRYELPADSYDPGCLRISERAVMDKDPTAFSAQPNVNSVLFSYKAVLEQLLGFEISELDGGEALGISKDGVSVAKLSCEWEDGTCYLNISFI